VAWWLVYLGLRRGQMIAQLLKSQNQVGLEEREELCYRRLWCFLPESFLLPRIGMERLVEEDCQYWSIGM
jgi:hypothetical protein